MNERTRDGGLAGEIGWVMAFVFAILLVFAMYQARPIGQARIGDPCGDLNTVKQSAAVSISSATTTQLVALTAGKAVYTCAFFATLGGTSPTLQFVQGTGTNCGSNQANLSGTFAPAPNGTEFFIEAGLSTFTTPSGAALCLTTAGTNPTANGVITYVVQ